MTQQTRIWATGPSGEVLPVVCDAQGNLVIQLEGATVNVGDVDVVSSALPTGAATAAKQDTGNAILNSIDGNLTEKVQLHANIDISQATAYTVIAAPGTGYRIRICQILLMSGASTPVNSEVAIKSGSTVIKTVKGASIALDFSEHCNLGTNEALVIQATTADRLVGGVDYYIEAV